ncbi:MAG TPA: lytic murein transglycosylase [Geminicoccaceae bacterium]|nr:lytic murein transglycosylase [Geminicoccaceae bacterium]
MSAIAAMIAAGLAAGAARAATQPFPEWLEGVRQEALAKGIAPATVAAALDGVQPIERVIELDRRQPEGRMTYRQYRDRVLSEQRIERGRELLREHRELLDRVGADYRVQPRFIVALWGIESNYGAWSGSTPVIGALATLAYDGRRADFFRSELMQALRILDEGNVEVDAMLGSWAGAMGQSQFMPSSYLRNAVDYDGDGRRDIWSSLPDVFASIANYLAKAGWDDRRTWGREVGLPGDLGDGLDGLALRRSLPAWHELGVRRADGTPLPVVALDASLLRTDDGIGPAYLVYNNFRVLMAWNRSTYFGLTVGQLADLIDHG